MLDVVGKWSVNCEGASRRSFLRAGVLGLGGLSLADLLKAKARGGESAAGDDLSVILFWLDGGPPQHETYDPKPEAPAEYRGPFQAIPTNTPGISLSEHLPYQARVADKMTLIRSVYHNNGDHFAAAHWMLTGFLGSNAVNLAPQYPSAGSIITKIKGAKKPGVPAYIGLPRTHSIGLSPGYHGAAYLGVGFNPYSLDADPNNPNFQAPNLALPQALSHERLEDRRGLVKAFDNARRDIDSSGLMEGLDRFSREAFDMISGPTAREAFDISQEDPRLRDRYGRNDIGQSALLARRLVERGARFVTITVGGWDYHVNIGPAMIPNITNTDRAAGALIAELADRGMLEKTIVIVMGEFGRTPRINPQAGRDHWGEVMSVMVAGGGFPGGAVVGSSNLRGEYPKDLPITPQDFLVTLYHKLGIDPTVSFVNRSGRPIPIGSNGRLIRELA